MSASPPVLPTFFMSPTPAIPVTTVQKMTGAISILMSLMNPSPKRLHRGAGLRVQRAEQHAERDRDNDLEIQGTAAVFSPAKFKRSTMPAVTKESPDLPGNSSGTGAR